MISSGSLGAEFLLGSLVEIGLTLVFRAGQTGKEPTPRANNVNVKTVANGRKQFRRVMPRYSIRKGLFKRHYIPLRGEIESRMKSASTERKTFTIARRTIVLRTGCSTFPPILATAPSQRFTGSLLRCFGFGSGAGLPESASR